MSVINTTMTKLFPAIGGAMAKAQIGRQQRDEPSHARQGTLYQAGEIVSTSGNAHGRGNENAANQKEAHDSNVRPA